MIYAVTLLLFVASTLVSCRQGVGGIKLKSDIVAVQSGAYREVIKSHHLNDRVNYVLSNFPDVEVDDPSVAYKRMYFSEYQEAGTKKSVVQISRSDDNSYITMAFDANWYANQCGINLNSLDNLLQQYSGNQIETHIANGVLVRSYELGHGQLVLMYKEDVLDWFTIKNTP